MGTPSGIGPMSVGDRVDVVIEGIGTLTNTIIKGIEICYLKRLWTSDD